MKKAGLPLVFILIFIFVSSPIQALAQKGNNGYEGGISAGAYKDRASLEYQEVCFITGEPIILKGELTIKKSRKQDVINATYTYNLRNSDVGAILTRRVVYSIQLSDETRGQKIEKITLENNPSEVLRVNNVSYILRDYEFDFSSLTDVQPAINYYASTILTKKVYQIGNVNDGRTVTQEVTGKIHGYDQYWGNVETASLDYVISWETPEAQWGGLAHVDYSNSVTNELVYVDNIPEEMSFKGRYIQRKNYSSILQYSCSVPELDAEGEPTYRIVETNSSLKLDAPSEQISLTVPELSHLRGHWFEEEIKKLSSLQIIKDEGKNIIPERFITRGEFVAAVMEAIKEVPEDPSLKDRASERRNTASRTRRRGSGVEEEEESPFIDLPNDHPYFTQINNAYIKSLVNGKGQGRFGTEDKISLQEALVVLIRALGLEILAPTPYAITPFADDNKISAYARNSVYVANIIGLINADQRGCIYPENYITIGETSVLLNKFIKYLCEGLKNDWEKSIKNTYSF